MTAYLPQNSDELSFKAGDRLTVASTEVEGSEDKDGWWELTNAMGESGLGPANYVHTIAAAGETSSGGEGNSEDGAGDDGRGGEDQDQTEYYEPENAEGGLMLARALVNPAADVGRHHDARTLAAAASPPARGAPQPSARPFTARARQSVGRAVH